VRLFSYCYCQYSYLLIHRIQNIAFSELVVECQQLMRQFACEQLRRLGVNESDAKLRASSCVSQRDIQVWGQLLSINVVQTLIVEGVYFLQLDNQGI